MITDYPCRKLRKLTGQSRPSRLLFIDTETKQRKAKIAYDGRIILSGWDEYIYGDMVAPVELHRFLLGWSCFCRYREGRGVVDEQWHFWRDSKQLCQHIESLSVDGEPLHIFAHNIYFDLQVSDFFYWFTLWGWVLDFIYDKGNVYILIISKGKRTIKCISTTNYVLGKLADVGELLKMPKTKIDLKTASISDKKWYCRNDTLIVKEFMRYYFAFIDRYGLGKFALTKSAQAFVCFRSRFMKDKIYPHKVEEVQLLEKACYMGGRTECGFLGKVPGNSFVALDVNGLYPTVMQDNYYPIKLIEHYQQPSIDELRMVLEGFVAVGRVYLKTDEPAYAKRHKHKIVFPVGSFVTHLCTEGLRYALERGHLQAIEELAVYSRAKIFTDHIRYFAGLKEQYSKSKNPMGREFAKYQMNCLYGKFAQHRPLIEEEQQIDYKGYSKQETYDTVLRRTETVTKMFNKLVVTYGLELCSDSFVAIAAHVTEYARFYLWRLIQKVGVGNMLYCDTDSLKIATKHLPKLRGFIDEHKQGFLKVEDRFSDFTICGAKYYMTEHETKIKGVPDTAVKVGDYKYQYTTFLKQASHLRSEVTRYYITKPTLKEVKPHYDKGTVLEDGRIVPLIFGVL